MPRKQICTVELREKLGAAILATDASVAGMCCTFGGFFGEVYKWIERYKTGGRGGLCNQPGVS
jgi:hypothetical protein